MTNLITLSEPHSAAAEAYQSLRTSIEFASLEQPLHTILIASANETPSKSVAVANLAGAKIVVHQTGDNRVDVTALKSSLLSDLYSNGQEALRQKEEQVKKLEQELAERNAIYEKAADIDLELRAQYPNIASIFLSDGVELHPDGTKTKLVQLTVRSTKSIPSADKTRIENWFKARSKSDAVVLNFRIEPQPTSAAKQGKAKV